MELGFQPIPPPQPHHPACDACKRDCCHRTVLTTIKKPGVRSWVTRLLIFDSLTDPQLHSSLWLSAAPSGSRIAATQPNTLCRSYLLRVLPVLQECQLSFAWALTPSLNLTATNVSRMPQPARPVEIPEIIKARGTQSFTLMWVDVG